MLTLLAIFTLTAPFYLVVNPPHLVCDSIDSDCSDLVHLEGDVVQVLPPEPFVHRKVLNPVVEMLGEQGEELIMTREEAKKLLPVIQGYAEGKAVQYRQNENEPWFDTSSPGFNSAVEYRIKPEPRRIWALINKAGGVDLAASNKSLLDPYQGVEVVEFIEVTKP